MCGNAAGDVCAAVPPIMYVWQCLCIIDTSFLAFLDCWQALIDSHEDDSGHADEKCSADGLVHVHEAFEGLVRPKPLRAVSS